MEDNFKIVAESNGHKWVRYHFAGKRVYVCCRDCGIIRRADDKNKPCPGIIKVEMRQE